MVFQFSKKIKKDKMILIDKMGDGKHGLFLSQKNWLKYDIYRLLKSSCFELFRDGKYDLFLRQKVD